MLVIAIVLGLGFPLQAANYPQCVSSVAVIFMLVSLTSIWPWAKTLSRKDKVAGCDRYGRRTASGWWSLL